MPSASSLSTVCNAVVEFLRTAIDAPANNIRVLLGSPAEAAGSTTEHRINLFFYRFAPSGFEAFGRPDEPWRIRLHCLVTAFGIPEDTISAGENDLRMLGTVMRVFHETPIMDAVDVSGETVRLQVVFNPLNDDQLNQIWSTQGDVGYRPSVAYEMALTPIVPEQRFAGSPLVGGFGTEVRGTMAARHQAFHGTPASPPVAAVEVDIENAAWVPRLCLIHGGNCRRTLGLDVDSAEFAAFQPAVWIAGDPAASVDLVWETWTSTGWSSAGPSVAAQPFGIDLDPDHIPSAVPGIFPVDLALPVALPLGENSAQALLYATRQYTSAPGYSQVLRSDPILITLYRSA